MSGRSFAFLVVSLATACATNDSNIGGGAEGGSGGTLPAGGGGAGGSSSGGQAPAGGAGGMGGQGGAVSTGGSGGAVSTGGQGQGGGGPNLCGNGVKDMGEQCDGQDFGGKTCADFGLSGGSLICNPFCGVVVASCTPAEQCNDGQDNDQDGMTDCADDECTAELACTDPCAAAVVMPLPFFTSGDMSGRPNVLSSSCVPSGGREAVYAVQATNSDPISVSFNLWGYDGAISVRTVCNDPATEIACSNNSGANSGEALSIPTQPGDVFYVIVESVNTSGDFYSVDVTQPFPESFCNDQWDDDSDGLLDCDDPNACQGSFECMAGPGALGATCFSNNECQSLNGDPICLNWNQGFNNGYCSEFCSGPGDCAGDGVCVDINISAHGVCFDGCQVSADCAPGTSCVDLGNGTKICDKPPELNCQDYADNDFDGLTDCEDPTACAASFSCQPGPNKVGSSCQIHAECEAQNGKPYCIDQLHEFWPGGYCSQFCTMGGNECPADSACTNWQFMPSGSGLCAETCNSPADCRPGYSCFDPGIGTNVCLF